MATYQITINENMEPCKNLVQQLKVKKRIDVVSLRGVGCREHQQNRRSYRTYFARN